MTAAAPAVTPESTASIELPVTGMTCASCQTRVQKSLGRQPGVRSAAVNLLTETATVAYDPLITGPDALIGAIRKTGYDASLPKPSQTSLDAVLDDDLARETRYRSLRLRASWALGLGFVVMLIASPLMQMGDHQHTADPLAEWLARFFDAPLRAVAPGLYTIDRAVLLGASLVLTVIIAAWAGREFFIRGWAAVRHGGADMNTLVALGALAGFAYSVAATFWPGAFAARGIVPEVYYEAVALIIALVLTGRTLEARAARQTASSLRALVALQPPTARVEREGLERDVPVGEIHPGDVVLVRPGERVPTDGMIASGETDIDQSMVTGESVPVARRTGDRVIGGTVNASGAFRYRATTLGAKSALARIVRLMREAQGARAPTQDLADRVSGVFVPTVMVAALATFCLWYFTATVFPIAHAVHASVTVLIIACPCAMGLAVPTAIMVATGRGAAMGALFKGGDALERLDGIDTIVLDKTGTVTAGKPVVTDIVPVRGFDESRLLVYAASLERGSEHPLAAALVTAAAARGLSLHAPEDVRNTAGRGVTGVVDGHGVAVGNAAFMSDWSVDSTALHTQADALANTGKSVSFISVDGAFAGMVAMRDELRPSSRRAVGMFRARGMRVVLLSGDTAGVAHAIARAAGIDDVIAGVLPEGKVDAIKSLQAQGRRVAMVGDGVNDAPALAQADVGIAMGSGTDVAMAAADLTLMHPDLRIVSHAMDLSRRTRKTMRQNLFWAFLYNIIGIPIAAGALYPAYGILLSPIIGSAAMALSDVFVVGNSLRLRAFRVAASEA